MFKNVIAYRFNKPFTINTEEMESQLNDFAFTPCGSQDISKFGFVPALSDKATALIHSARGMHLIRAAKEEKILPSQVVKNALDERVDAIEYAEARKISKKEKDAIKDDVITTLLPRAFSKKSHVSALILPELNMILIDSSSHKKAEELLALMRKAFGSLPVAPVQMKTPVELTMTEWVKSGELPATFFALDEAELVSDSTEGGIIRVKQQDLTEDEVLAHIATGKQVSKLAMGRFEIITFVLKSDTTISRLKFSEEYRSQTDEVGNDDLLARLDTDFLLMGREIKLLIRDLHDALGGVDAGE